MRPFTRQGLHRLECEACGNYVYGTVAALESHGLPACPCGPKLMPTRRELAMLLGVRCAAIVEFETAKELGMDDRQAGRWVEAKRRERAEARRMAIFT